MLKNQLKKLTVAALIAAMIVPVSVSNAAAQQTTRISGKDRITTSVEISKSAYTTSENVVLASGFNFADALSAGQLASALNAPLLLSSQNKLDSQTKNEIERLKAKKVYVVGGDNAISKSGVDTTLKSENIDVARLEGQDRYSTSQKVMEKTKEIINPEYLLIASGKNFPDALAATSFFVNHKSVMVLSDGNSYPSSNLKEIAIGGKMQLPLEKFKGERISGRSRYETALAIAKRSFNDNDNENVVLASGQVFADSLSAVSLTKKHKAPIILTQSDYLTENAKKYLNGKNVFIVGGEKTVVNKIMTNITTEERAKIGSFNLEEEIEKVLDKKKNNDNINLEKEIEKILDRKQTNQNQIIKQEIEKLLAEKQKNQSIDLEKEIEKILDRKQSNQNQIIKQEIEKLLSEKQKNQSIDLEKEIEKILDKKQSNQNQIIKQEIEELLSEKQKNQSIDLEKEIERILDKKQSNQNVDLEKEIDRVITKRRLKDSLEVTEASIADAKKRLAEYKEKLKEYKEDPENIKKFEEQIKRMQEENEKYEKFDKEKIDESNKRIEEVDKAIPLIDKRVNEGVFAFLEWVAENRPNYKKDADNALAILNEYYKKGDVRKTPEDATSYENLLASADLLKQFNEYTFKNANSSSGMNFSILAKAMISCNRYVYSSNSEKNTFNVTEHLYTGEGNPIEYWYNDGKAVRDELVRIIKEKYTKEPEYIANNKAKEEYKRIHGKEPDFGLFGELLNRDDDIIAIARNTSKNVSNNTFCLNGDSQNSYGIWMSDSDFSAMIFDYKRETNEQELLKDKERAQQTIKEVEEYRKEREKNFERIKNYEDFETDQIRMEIRWIENDIANWEKSLKEKKEAYEKLK